jgi:hypothetical protein
MPRKPIDYSNTIIYKLCCNDPSITDIYVGHTTDFTNRKRGHKFSCNNEYNKSYNIYVYQFIRDHGGWANWSMVEIEKISCIDSNDACKNERRNIELLGATLNRIVPSRTYTEWREDHKEEIREQKKIYNEKHKEEIREQTKKYKEDHKKEIREQNKKYNEEHREKIREYQQKYRKDHKEYNKEYMKKYRKDHISCV